MADGLRVYSTALRHAQPHRQPAAVFVLLEAVGPVGWPARNAHSASAGATSKRVRAAPSRPSASLASAPDPRPSRVPRTRLRETGNGSAARPCGAGCKQGNRKGLRLWCLRINRLQTKTETPFRFGRTRAGSASSKHARSRPAAGWLASPRRALEWRHSSDRWTGVARRSAGLAGGLKSLRAGTFRER
jgi:hypothetical protein